jgi:hypothetical protein
MHAAGDKLQNIKEKIYFCNIWFCVYLLELILVWTKCISDDTKQKCANSLGLQVQSDVAREFSPQGWLEV